MTSETGASKKLNYHLKTNKNTIDKANILSNSPTVEDKFQSKTNNIKHLSNFNSRMEKKPAPVIIKKKNLTTSKKLKSLKFLTKNNYIINIIGNKLLEILEKFLKKAKY